MKLSELETEKAYDMLCELTPHVESIVTDNELIEELRQEVDFSGCNTVIEKYTAIVGKFSKILPTLMKKKKDDIFSIVAIVNDVTIETVKKQNVLVTMTQIKELIQDKELIDFFKSFKNAEGGE